MDDYGLQSWGIDTRCKLLKKLNSSLDKLRATTNIDIPHPELHGNIVQLHIIYFKNFIKALKQELI